MLLLYALKNKQLQLNTSCFLLKNHCSFTFILAALTELVFQAEVLIKLGVYNQAKQQIKFFQAHNYDNISAWYLLLALQQKETILTCLSSLAYHAR